MEFATVVAERQSIRQFAATEIAEPTLQAILDTVIRAPSAGNLQAYDVYVVRSRSVRSALAEAALNQDFITQAPVALVFCAVPQRSAVRYRGRGETLYSVQDATIACTFAMLAATDEGLSSVWVGAFDEVMVNDAIGAADGHRPVAILPIGVGDETPDRRARRSKAEACHDVL